MSLINKLPSFYDNDITKPIQDSFSVEANSINDEVENTLNQFFVDSATYGLDYWEKMLGISKNNNDIQTKRENIKAKMRSRGTTTLSVIKNICEAYSNGEVDVIVNYSDYSFIIDFVGTVGVPKAFAELDKTINEIKPCHLAHSYKFNYNTNTDLSKFTHEELSKYTHEELKIDEKLRGDEDTSVPSYGNILISTDVINIEEGNSTSFTVCLDKAPTDNQVVSISKNNNDVILDKSSLIFTSSNYDIPQVININVLEDDDYLDETCIITLSSKDVLSKTIVVNITDNDSEPTNIQVQSISLNKNALTLKLNESETLIATIYPSDATNQNITWESSNDSVGVSSNGVVSALKEGNAIVTVTTEDGNKTAACDVTVNSSSEVIKVTGITVSDWDVKLGVGQTKQLTFSVIPSNATNKLIHWYSNNTSVATVNSSGLIVAKGVGYSKVTATTDDGGIPYDVHVNVF